MFILQVLFFIAVAFGLGCLFGYWLKSRTVRSQHHSGAASAVTHEGAAKTATAGELAAPRPHYEPAASAQPASSVTPRPNVEAKAAPAAATTTPVKKATKPKTAKSAATKPAAKSTSSKPRTTKAAGAAAAKTKADKPAATKPAAAKSKPPKAKPVAADVPDNLKQIKGVGPQIEAKLNAAGINSFAQIAVWTKKEQTDFAEQLSFAGRIAREEWVSQAKILAKGGSTDFAKRVAKGKVASSSGSKPKRGGKN